MRARGCADRPRDGLKKSPREGGAVYTLFQSQAREGRLAMRMSLCTALTPRTRQARLPAVAASSTVPAQPPSVTTPSRISTRMSAAASDGARRSVSSTWTKIVSSSTGTGPCAKPVPRLAARRKATTAREKFIGHHTPSACRAIHYLFCASVAPTMSGDGRPQIALLPGLRAEFPPRVVALLTSGGLRGGVSVALALALPAS